MAHEPNKEEQKLVSVTRGMDKENVVQDFPCGLVAKNPLANAGYTGSLPSAGRYHMSQGNQACAPQLLSPGSTARALQQKKPLQWDACALQLRGGPACHN